VIFKSKKDHPSQLDFVGDFECMYTDIDDPWGQSASNLDEIGLYYSWSRPKINTLIENEASLMQKKLDVGMLSISEIGCGLGVTTKFLTEIPTVGSCFGFDISATAIKKARINVPNANFDVANILERPLPQKTNLVVVSNMIWYILQEVDLFVENIAQSLVNGNGRVVIYNSLFKRDQRYALGLVEHTKDLLRLFELRTSIKTPFEKTFKSNEMIYDLGYCSFSISDDH